MSFKSKTKTQKNTNTDLIFAKKLYYENKSRYKNRKLTNDEWMYNKIISEIILQIYLIYSNYRQIAEIKLSNIDPKIKKLITEYLKKNKINYEFVKDKYKPNGNFEYLYLFKKKSDINSINNNRGVKLADELGKFYTCKTEYNEWKNYEWRIGIFCDEIELFAQMCTQEKIAENINITMNIYDEVRDLLIKLDEQKFKHTIPNPFRIHIYKTKIM